MLEADSQEKRPRLLSRAVQSGERITRFRAPILHMNRLRQMLVNEVHAQANDTGWVCCLPQAAGQKDCMILFQQKEGNDKNHIFDKVNKQGQKCINDLVAETIYVLGSWDW